MNLATPFNKESIDEIGNTFWKKDLMTVVTINKNNFKRSRNESVVYQSL